MKSEHPMDWISFWHKEVPVVEWNGVLFDRRDDGYIVEYINRHMERHPIFKVSVLTHGLYGGSILPLCNCVQAVYIRSDIYDVACKVASDAVVDYRNGLAVTTSPTLHVQCERSKSWRPCGGARVPIRMKGNTLQVMLHPKEWIDAYPMEVDDETAG